MRVLLDANILLDAALKREHYKSANHILNACQDSLHQGYIAWHSVAVFHYICSRKKGDQNTRLALSSLLDYIEITPSDTSMVKAAIQSTIKDFEDALQVVAAMKCGCDYIITRNIKDFKNSLIPAIYPEDFISI